MNFGLIGLSDIAIRRFLPALEKEERVNSIYIASISGKNIDRLEHNDKIIQVYRSYNEIINDDKIDAVYISTVPSLHFEMIEKCIKAGKKIFCEKPLVTSYEEAKKVARLADEYSSVVLENYMFLFHPVHEFIKDIIDSGKIGKVRHFISAFTVPINDIENFRFNKRLGGGAILDTAGYPIKAAQFYLGETLEVKSSILDFENEVDIYGTSLLCSKDGIPVSISFGFKSVYQCFYKIIGEAGSLQLDRAFTPPSNFRFQIKYFNSREEKIIEHNPYDQFELSLKNFIDSCNSIGEANSKLQKIIKHQEILEAIRRCGGEQV